MKTIYSPHHRMHVKMGRLRPAHRPKMFLRDYLTATPLPTPPATLDWTPAAAQSLADIYDNDTLGCCVISGGYHYLGVATGNAGSQFHAAKSQIVADYGAIGGYVPGDPSTDQGCDEQTAMDYWVSHGFANGSKLAGWIGVDGTNQTRIMQAIDLFENVFFGMELPDKWTNPMPSGPGFVWDVAGAPDPSQGHAVVGVGYTTKGVIIDSWGMLGLITWAAIAKYATPGANGELYTMVSDAMIAKGKQTAPNGFDWTRLIDDFNAMGGNIPVPVPTPSPTPVPPPKPTPTPTPVPPAPTPTPVPPAPTPTPPPSPIFQLLPGDIVIRDHHDGTGIVFMPPDGSYVHRAAAPLNNVVTVHYQGGFVAVPKHWTTQ